MTEIERLEPFIGEWTMEAVFPHAEPVETEGRARTVFEWLPGNRFVVQRWEVPHPDAPDGIAVIGYDAARQTLLQHYFDSRGVARVYEMGFDGETWTLERTQPDFAPLDFAQRYRGTFSEDKRTIEGAWELTTDGGQWQHDFDLTYSRIG